jgi:hypothetical protein
MTEVYYNTESDKIYLLRFYPDNKVIETSYNHKNHFKENYIKSFDRNYQSNFRNYNLFQTTEYLISDNKINFSFTKKTSQEFECYFNNEGDLIASIKSNGSSVIKKKRYSIFSNYPKRNDFLEIVRLISSKSR